MLTPQPQGWMLPVQKWGGRVVVKFQKCSFSPIEGLMIFDSKEQDKCKVFSKKHSRLIPVHETLLIK